MDVGGLLTIVVAALAILGAGGSAWAFLADRGNKSRLTNLRDDIGDRDVRIKFLEDENERKARETEAKDKINREQADTILTLRSEVNSLTEYVNASAGPIKILSDLVQTLAELVTMHHETAVTGIATLETQNADILRIVGERRNVPHENLTREVTGNA